MKDLWNMGASTEKSGSEATVAGNSTGVAAPKPVATVLTPVSTPKAPKSNTFGAPMGLTV